MIQKKKLGMISIPVFIQINNRYGHGKFVKPGYCKAIYYLASEIFSWEKT